MTTHTDQVEIPPDLEARFQKRIDQLLEDYPDCPRHWLHQQLFHAYIVHNHQPESVTISESD